MGALAWRAGAAAAALAVSASATQAQTLSEVVVTGAGAGGLQLTQKAETGSRLGLTPLETPASVEVLSGDTIRARGDLNLADAISRSTGIVQQNDPGNGGTANFAARGFSGVGSVLNLYDGVRMMVGAGTVTFPFDPWTVDRVEVLKGPASVLYGQGAIGGAVNVIPKRPSFGAANYQVQVGVGSEGTLRSALGAGGKLSDTLAYRLDVSANRSDGYVDRGDSDSLAISGALTWMPVEALSFTLSHDFGNQRPMRYFGVPLIDDKLDERTLTLNYNVYDSRIRYRDGKTQLRADWEPADGIKVRNTAYLLTTNRIWRNAECYTYDPDTRLVDRTCYTPIEHQQRQYGDVFDVAFSHDLGPMRNSLALGAEANDVRFARIDDGFPDTTTTVNPFRFDPGTFDEQASYIPRFRTNTGQYGLFAEDQLKLTPELSVVGGLRYEHYHIRRTDLTANQQVYDRRLENTSWRVGAVYQATPSLSVYAQYGTGADPVGSLITANLSQSALELATGRQVEAGVKGLFLGGRGEWTLAAYQIVKKKLLTRVANQPTQQQQVGQASSKGLEASLSVQLGGGWSVDANGTVLEARYDDFTDISSGVGISRKGKTPPNTPQASANLWLSWQLAPAWRVYGGARYVGKQYGDNANSAVLVLPSYTVADLGVEWKLRENLTVNAQLFNALDRTYAYTTYGDEQWILGRPRAFEVRLNGKF